MSEQSIPLLSLPVTASGAVVAQTFIGHDGSTASADGNTLGVARSDAADTDDFTADVIGTAVVLSAEAITVGAALEVGASGKAAVQSSGVTVARALQAADGADEPIEVLLIAN